MKNKKSVNTALDKPQKTNNGLKYGPESHCAWFKVVMLFSGHLP